MKIAITTPTGQIGSKLAYELLEPVGHQVTLLVRNPAKVWRATDHGATLKIGDLTDAGFVRRATEDIDALFWLTPPNLTCDDPIEFQRALARNAAQAIVANRIGRVVNLSSIGAQHKKGTGPIVGLHDTEAALTAAAREIGGGVLHLRVPFFMENFLMLVPAMRTTGTVPLPVKASVSTPMIATADVAQVAAQLLAHEVWHGVQVRELLGPADYTFNTAAEIIGDAVGKTLKPVAISPQQAMDAMAMLGASKAVAENFVEMFRAMEEGLIKPTVKRSPENSTATRLEDFARQRIAPAIRAGSGELVSYAMA